MSENIRASIIILTHNNLDYTRQCLESIQQNTGEPGYEIIVVDNASQDGTPAYLGDYAKADSNVSLILNEENLGFPAGNNLGAEAASGDYIVFLNNDIVVTRGWLSDLIAHLDDPSVGMVGPVTNRSGNETCIPVAYESLDAMEVFAEKYVREHKGQILDVQMLPFHCVALRRSVFDQIGPLDEKFGLGMFEDDDYAMRLRENGYRLICAEDVFVHHWGSVSFSKLDLKTYAQVFNANRKYFETKWGVQWQIPKYREELIGSQLMQMVEEKSWLIDQVLRRDRQILASGSALERAENQVAGLQDELDSLRAERAEFQNTISQFESKVGQLENAIHHAQNQRDKLQTRLKQTEHALTRSDCRIGHLETSLAQAGQKLDEARHELAGKIQELAQIETEWQQAEEKLALSQTQNLEFAARLVQVQDELDDVYVSKAWAVAYSLRLLRLFLIPLGSRREKFARGVYRGARQTINWVKNIPGWRPSHLSWYAYNFDGFKRARNSKVSAHLSSVECPTSAGKVSIVLPVYNGETYLEESLESILSQTYSNFEVILVDDGSIDSSPEIGEKYAQKDARIRVIRQENQGLPAALSNGFQHTSGEFLTWTSDDNRMKPSYLEKMVSWMQERPQDDMVYANVDIIGPDGEYLQDSKWFEGYQNPPGSEHVWLPDDPSELNIWPNNYVCAAFMYRDRVPFLVGGYSVHRFGAEDYDYWMRVNALLNLRHVKSGRPVYEYRFHPSTLTSRDDELGITRDRDKLMIFDDFRRDFYTYPLIWYISSESQNASLVDQLEQWVTRSGHVLAGELAAKPGDLPRLWMPKVYVRILDDASRPIQTPDNAHSYDLRVLIVLGEGALPDEVDLFWDLCITLDGQNRLPRLAGNHRGWLRIPQVEDLCTAIDIRARTRHLQLLETEIANPPNSGLKFSVVVCTYRRGSLLMDTLRSVVRQSLSLAEYEIIVVNNDPADESVDAIVEKVRDDFCAEHPSHLKPITCPLKGLSFARNAGISEARGEIVSFIDDDARANYDWLEQIWGCYQKYPHAGVIGGRIQLEIPSPRPRWLKPGWEKFWSQFLPGFSEPKLAGYWWEFPWGANWSARRAALVAIGGFRAKYGRRGSDFSGGEELVAASLIKRLGYDVAVVPASEVLHAPSPERFTFKHVWNTIRSGKRVEYRQQLDFYIPMELSFRTLLKQKLGYIRDAFWGSKPWHVRLENLIYAWTQFELLRLLGRDMMRRFRKPVSLR